MPPASLEVPAVGKPTKRSFAQGLVDWIVYLNSLLNSSEVTNITNGSFEKYTGTNLIPDAWEFVADSGGSAQLDTSTQDDGAYSFKIVVPGGTGNGGGYLQQQDNFLVPWSANEDLYIKWKYKVDTATIHNKVEVLWYDKSKNFISASTIWDVSSGQSTTWACVYGKVLKDNIPATACFYRVRATGGVTDSVAGTTYYDNFKSFVPSGDGKVTVNITHGTYTFHTGPNTISLIAEMVGAGGGSGDDNFGHGSGAGGGGAMNRVVIAVNPDTDYSYTVGQAGISYTSGSTDGTDGGATIFSTFTVPGGKGGKSPVGGSGGVGGAGGTALSRDYSTVLNSANGTAGTNGSNSFAGAGGVGGIANNLGGVLFFTSVGGLSDGSGSGVGAGAGGASGGGSATHNATDGGIAIYS